MFEKRDLRTEICETFRIVEKSYGEVGIRAMFSEFFCSYKAYKDIEKLTELVIALNWKIREKYEEKNTKLQEVYNELRIRADQFCLDNFKGKELKYFLHQTD